MSTLAERIREGGPGWLQGAMTLGGGSAITSLSIGAMFGYEYLWVQPVAMLIGPTDVMRTLSFCFPVLVTSAGIASVCHFCHPPVSGILIALPSRDPFSSSWTEPPSPSAAH